MSADIISSLQLDKSHIGGRVFVAKELKECDSSFITSCVLGHCIKNKCPTLLILTHNSISHYQNVGLRMFYNLKKSIETGVIDVYDVGNYIINNLLDSKSVPVKDLWKSIENRIKAMKEKYGTVNIIMDGVTHLYDLQYNLKEVNWLCREIIKDVRSMEQSFVLFHCNVSSDDDVIASLLSHMAYVVLEVENLSSGWSTDISGHLTVRQPGKKFEDNEIAAIIDPKQMQYHFKLFDKGVKLLAPGAIQ